MTRVSENSGKFALNRAISRSKKKLEDLQLKGTTLRELTKPSDNPTGNMDYLELTSRMKDTTQYKKNIDFARTSIEYTEASLEELSEIILKAKEIAIAQSSDFYNDSNRANIANEVVQLKHHALAIANRRMGNRFIFGGYTTLSRPFDSQGKYFGDDGKITLEVAKDFFVPTNLNGKEVFYTGELLNDHEERPLENFPKMIIKDNGDVSIDNNQRMGARDTASLRSDNLEPLDKEVVIEEGPEKVPDNLMTQLDTLISGLEAGDKNIIKDLLERFDASMDRIISLRTKLGGLYRSIAHLEENVDKTNILNADRRSKIADADIAQLYSELGSHQNALNATYKSGHAVLNKSLLDFIR